MTQPNIIIILADDLGFSDLGCFGGEIPTPNLDRLAGSGVRMTQCYNTARCSPSRASLLTGRHPHETGVAILTDDGRPDGYPGTLSNKHPTLAERLQADGYATCLAGKWHLSANVSEPNESWPTRRGFEEFYGILGGAGDYFSPRALYDGEDRLPVPDPDEYYFTDAVSDRAADFARRSAAARTPFFLYLAYTAPHWPLHAPEEAIARHEATYRVGWDVLRERRLERARCEGVIGEEAALSDRDGTNPAWEDENERDWQARRMATYAAQVEILDQGVGRLLEQLDSSGVREDTLVLFLSDNGPCAEDMPPMDAPHFMQRQPQATADGRPMRIGNRPDIAPGAADTYASYGFAWANLSNVPFRLYKRWTHEGGIATPLIAHWPNGGLEGGSLSRRPAQLTDIAPTVLDAAGAKSDGPGVSLLDDMRGSDGEAHALFWEHIGNAAVRDGDWKAVREAEQPWELYDLSRDRSELHDLSAERPEILARLIDMWERWADRVGVLPWETIKERGA